MQKIVVGNMKMNILSLKERVTYIDIFKKEIANKKFDQTEIVLCPPYIHLEAFSKISKKIKIGAQNVYVENSGSYTGEVSPLMVKNFDCKYVIVGHSERRKYFGESNHLVNQKMIAVLRNGLKPILCVGETAEEKNSQSTLNIIASQLREALVDIDALYAMNIMVAYEPIWAIGSSVVPNVNEIMEARLLIRKLLVDIYGHEIADQIPILYGGNVTTDTVVDTCIKPEMDGVLVGRESLHPHQFIKIAEIINNN